MSNLQTIIKDEAEITVRKTKEGRYCDLTRGILHAKNIKRLTKSQLMESFAKLRLRFTLTPQCNIWCVFCSNEGSTYTAKSEKHADIDLIIKLCKMLFKKTPVKQVDFSGGEPLIHPDFLQKKYKLIKFVRKNPKIRFSLHTNGIKLIPEIINEIKDNFSRIGISIHSLNFEAWNKITNTNNQFPKNVQLRKFNQIMKNIEFLGKQKIGDKVFLKSVIMKDINDSPKELKAILEMCVKYHFHPKFLQFEPQYLGQEKFIVERAELFSKLERLGCKFAEDAPRHNDPKTYIPGVNFIKPGAAMGLHSIFGCGQEGACMTCYDFLCMFVKPLSHTKGLYLKPCAVLDTRIDLTHAIKTTNYEQLLDLFRISREYLMLAPGLGTVDWNKEDIYMPNSTCR